ncbi:MAG: hypothetical protein Q9217_002413 [Psora testacea]
MGLHNHELDTVDTVDTQNMQKSPYHSETEAPTSDERDAYALARLGKRFARIVRASTSSDTVGLTVEAPQD